MDYPKISIITPSFNQGAFIEQTIRSVLYQSYPNLEYIIIDGGSTDNTPDILRKYGSQIAFWESKPDKGQSDALHKGFKRASGALIAYINSDDVYLPGAFEAFAKAYCLNPDAAIYSGGIAIGDSRGFISKCSFPTKTHKMFANRGIFGFGQPSSFFNAGIYRRIPGVNEKLYMRMDADLMFRLYREHSETVIVDCLASFFRWQPNSKSTLSGERYYQECKAFVREIGSAPGEETCFTLLFKIKRLLDGGYLKSSVSTLRLHGKNISELWKGRL